MRKIFPILLLLFFTTACFAQKKWKEYLDSAVILKDNNAPNALEFYLLAKNNLPNDSSNTHIKARILYDIAYLNHIAKKYTEAALLYEEAKNIWVKIYGKESTYYATSCNTLASLYYSMGQYEKAEALIIEAKNIREKILGKNDQEYIESLMNLAQLYWHREQYKKAEPLYVEIKGIREKTIGKDHSDYANTCHTLALLYYKLKQYEKAEPLFLEARNVWVKSQENEASYYTASYNLALLYEDTRQYDKAESLFLEVMKNEEKVSGKESEDYMTTSGHLALIYYNKGKYEKAEFLYLEIIKFIEKTLGKDHQNYAQYNNAVASVYTKMNQYDKAEYFYLQAKSIRERIFGKNHPLYAATCNSLAFLYNEMGHHQKAEALYLEAKNIREKVLGKNHPDYATTCHDLAFFYNDLGQYEKAGPLILEAKSIREKVLGNNHPDYANSCNNLASFYMHTGQYEKAELFYLEAKVIYEKNFGKINHDYATSCSNLALLYAQMGKYEKAEPLIIEAKNINEKISGKDHPDYALACNNLASLYQDMGQYEAALALSLEAKNVFEKALGKLHPHYVIACSNVATNYTYLKLYKSAEPLFLEAKSIREKIFGKDHPDYALSCNNLAMLYDVMKQNEKVLDLLLESRKIYEKAYGKMHPVYATSCNNLGAIYMKMKIYEKAETLFTEAKQIREKVLGKQHEEYAISCGYLAELNWILNKNAVTNELYKEKFNIEYRLVQSMLQFTSEKEKASYIKNIIGNNTEMNSFYYQGFPHAKAAVPYTASFLSRNLILASSQQLKKAVYNSRDEAAMKDFEKWMDIKKQLAALYSKGQNSTYIKELEDSANIKEKNLARVSSAIKKQTQEKSWQDIQKSLNDNETAIEFVEFKYYTGTRWTDSTYYIALVLQKDKPEPVLVPLFEKRQLDSILLQTGNKTTNDNVKNLYASRGVEGDDTVILNRSLYKLIWGPLENKLKGINTVYFAPAGLLHRIAFAALPINDKEVLSDKYKLITLSSTANIVDQQSYFVSPSDKINLYGGIKYNVDTTELKKIAIAYHSQKETTRSLPDDLTRGAGWNDLPGTKKETDGIISIADKKNNVSVLSGIQATEESIKALDGKSSPVVLHIATHGFFFPDPKKDKKDDLLKSTESGKAFKQSDDPLFRSGLLFAGANTAWSGKAIEGIEDGILTSYEVSNMYLPNTKLVVLSACETGLGDIQGAEGVYGLQRAFKMAGAENLIMSLWKVPDAETAEFMQELYKNLFSKQSIADAFYNAQTTMKNKYRNDPYKWAAWVMVR